MKTFFLLLLASLLVLPAHAQKGKVTTAALALEGGDYMKAKESIDLAITNEDTKVQGKTWKIRGDVYLGIYESKVFLPQVPDALNQAEISYKNGFELETNPKKKGDVTLGLGNTGIYMFQEGVQKFQDGKYGEAYVLLDESRKINNFMLQNALTTDLDTNYILVTAYAAQNIQKYQEAIDLYRQLYKLKYDNETVYSNLADLLLLDDKNDEEAIKIITEGRERYPNEKSLIISELNYYLKKGKASDITDKLEAAIIADPQNPALYFALGTAYDQQKDYVKAKEAYLSAIDKNPTYYDAYFNLGAIYYNQAVEITKTMNMVPDNDMKTYKQLEAQRNELYKTALPYLEKSLELKPDSRDSKVALKEIYARMSMFDKLKSLD